MLGILGSGFGLYGYLPAAVDAGYDRILLPIRYREKLEVRSELKCFYPKIIWAKSDDEVCENASSLVYSKRPIDQLETAAELLAKPQLNTIIFEKPLAPNPDSASELLKLIYDSRKKCSVGFILRFTQWAISLSDQIKSQSSGPQQIWSIKWQFLAHHFKHNLHTWKRDHSQGGGVLRFYGIQFIALLSDWGYNEAAISKIGMSINRPDFSLWQAVFRGKDLPEIRLEIDSGSSHTQFCVKSVNDNKFLHSSSDIFDFSNSTLVDARCKFLTRLLLNAETQEARLSTGLVRINNLWEQVENSTIFIEV